MEKFADEFVKLYVKKDHELFIQRMQDHPSSLGDVNYEQKLYREISEIRHDLLKYRELLDKMRDNAEYKETKKLCGQIIAEIDLALED